MTKPPQQSDIVLFRTTDEKISISVVMEHETVWLTQEQMAELFGKGRSTITEHVHHIFSERELEEKVVCREFRRTTQHGAIKGKTQDISVKYYNLDTKQYICRQYRRYHKGVSRDHHQSHHDHTNAPNSVVFSCSGNHLKKSHNNNPPKIKRKDAINSC